MRSCWRCAKVNVRWTRSDPGGPNMLTWPTTFIDCQVTRTTTSLVRLGTVSSQTVIRSPNSMPGVCSLAWAARSAAASDCKAAAKR